ncbi:hypothetical protein WS45_25920 [Burkholderia sp. RF2-non_BP3]|nr:hypothetical protein WS45_25920 [Burkholderia sp. RF2-non_BP3]
MRENTEKLDSRKVAMWEQLRWAANVCDGCNWVAILGGLVDGFLAGFRFRRFVVVRRVHFLILRVPSPMINQLMIVSACTVSGRCDCAANLSVYRHLHFTRKLFVIFMK